MAEQARHRGRIQAQGGGLEESEPWSRDTPPTAQEGRALLYNLRTRLTAIERQTLELAFEGAETWILRAGRAGGVHVGRLVIKKTFRDRRQPGAERVDIEVISGSAFVPDPRA